MKIYLRNKEDGREIDGSLFFIDDESDDCTASLETTLNNIMDKWELYIDDKLINNN